MAIRFSIRGVVSVSRHLLTAAILLGFVLTFSSCKDENSVEATNRNYTEQIKKVVDAALDSIKRANPQFPGGLAMKVIYPGGEEFYQTGFTNAVTPTTHFRAASNTKTLTSTAILLLYQRGKLDINAKITDTIPGKAIPYVPEDQNYAIPFKSEITILQLLQHRAGVFDVSNDPIPDTISAPVPYKGGWYSDYINSQNPNHTYTFDELLGVVAATGLYTWRPGTGYKYSNTGYSMLGKIIERVSGKAYGDFIMDEVIRPMGMTSSSMPALGTDNTLPVPFVPGYVQTAGEIRNSTISNISLNVAEGNLITTVDDLSLFIRKLIRGEGVLSPNTVYNTMLNCLPTKPGGITAYGCGVHYVNLLGYGHTGAHEGYLSQMEHDPVTDVTVVMFTNGWDLREYLTSLTGTMNIMQDALYRVKRIVLTK